MHMSACKILHFVSDHYPVYDPPVPYHTSRTYPALAIGLTVAQQSKRLPSKSSPFLIINYWVTDSGNVCSPFILLVRFPTSMCNAASERRRQSRFLRRQMVAWMASPQAAAADRAPVRIVKVRLRPTRESPRTGMFPQISQ